MLVSSFTRINVVPVKAYEFTLIATVNENPYYGYYGGYHAIWASIKNDLAAIGINVEIVQYNEFNWWKRVRDVGWDKPWAEGGWDLTIFEWRLQPHALDPWFTSLVRSDLTPDEGGNNIAPWNNSDADELLRYGMTEFNALTRKTYMDAWQEVFMKDPPWINLYYTKLYEVIGRYITGYDPSATWFYDTAHLNLNNTMLAEAREWGERPAREPNTAIYAIVEPLWALNPMFMYTRTDELQSTLQWRTLYKWSSDPFPTDGSIPSWADYKIVPDMAADYPEYLNGGLTVRVTLRDGMVWQYNNGSATQPITADDVVWTFETVLDPTTTATGRGEFAHVINNVTKVNATTVDFNLNYTHSGFLSILANDWGTGCILPKHFFVGGGIPTPRTDPSNKGFSSPDAWMPVSGPFMLDPDNPPLVDDKITLIKNPSYYGYADGWGPYNIDKFILQWVMDSYSRLRALINNDIDFGEYPVAPPQTFKDLNNTANYPYLRVVQYDYPASNPVWLNFNNEYLSNRYIRMAIANAIDYDYIINSLLPPWGIETAIRGKTPILPQHYYTDENGTTVQLYNTAISPYTQNVTRALEYMDRWKKSQVGYTSPYPGGIYLEGAAGDANFDGVVNVLDLGIWRDEGWPIGTMPLPFLPGQDKDPDFNNDGSIDQNPDYYIYRDEVPGKIYFPNPYS
jgi:ABC-type transport system substrate-binding protein